jgi:epsilon-lactone hydrolase
MISRRSFSSLSLGAFATGTLLSTASGADGASDASTTGAAKVGATGISGTQGRRDGVLVPEHFVPTPRTISPQAQAFLSNVPPVQAKPMPPKEDLQAWKAFREDADRMVSFIIKHYADQFPGKVDSHQLSSSTLYEVTPNNLAPEHERLVILYIHGGGYIQGGGQACVYPAHQMAGLSKTRVFSLDYRLAPEHPFPAALDDSVEAYRFILKKYKPHNVAIFGPSAGANLAPVCILKARELGLPLPGACAVHSAPSDMSDLGDSAYVHDTVDIVLKHPSPELHDVYANGHDLKDPLLSPRFADFSKGFPPTILTSGTRDLLLSGTVLLHRALCRAGIKAELHVWEAMCHAPFFGAPEEDELYNQHVSFMLEHIGKS